MKIKNATSTVIAELKDAYNPPQVLSIISKGYKGNIDDIIVIHAVDDFKVILVQVNIFNSNNELIEKGEATTDKHGVLWVYTITVGNTNVKGCVIKATAFDIPENEDTLETIL